MDGRTFDFRNLTWITATSVSPVRILFVYVQLCKHQSGFHALLRQRRLTPGNHLFWLYCHGLEHASWGLWSVRASYFSYFTNFLYIAWFDLGASLLGRSLLGSLVHYLEWFPVVTNLSHYRMMRNIFGTVMSLSTSEMLKFASPWKDQCTMHQYITTMQENHTSF